MVIAGECLAHFCCAAWSDGVVQSESVTLQNVDKAVCKGMRQRCNGCTKSGATICCRHPGCGKKYHYPCASGYGGFLDIKGLLFLCPEHVADTPELSKSCRFILFRLLNFSNVFLFQSRTNRSANAPSATRANL